MVADVTGDGKADAVVMYPTNGNWYVALSTGSSFIRDPNTWLWATGFGMSNGTEVDPMVADVTGDGKADAVVMFPSDGDWYVAPSTGTSFSVNQSTWQWASTFGMSNNTAMYPMVADVTGDGKADAVVMFPSDGDWYVAPSTGTSFSVNQSTWQWASTFGMSTGEEVDPMVADVTGDGKADAVVMFPSDGDWYVAPSTATSFSVNQSTWQWATTFGMGS
jgi:hypothetical protein